MSLTCPVSCVYDFFSYRVSVYLIDWNWYHSKNKICSVMSLMMMGLDPGPLLLALFLFTLVNPFVVLDNPLVVFVS